MSFDSDGLTAEELSEIRGELGFSTDLKQCAAAVKPFEPKGMLLPSLKIHYGILLAEKKAREELTVAFRLLDKKRTGRITRETLRETAKSLNEKLSEQTIKEMMAEADIENKGYLTENDYINFLMSDWMGR